MESETQQYYKIGQIVTSRAGGAVCDDSGTLGDFTFIIVGFPDCNDRKRGCPPNCKHCLGLKSINRDFLVKKCGFNMVNTGYFYSSFRVLRNDPEMLEKALGQGCNLI